MSPTWLSYKSWFKVLPWSVSDIMVVGISGIVTWLLDWRHPSGRACSKEIGNRSNDWFRYSCWGTLDASDLWRHTICNLNWRSSRLVTVSSGSPLLVPRAFLGFLLSSSFDGRPKPTCSDLVSHTATGISVSRKTHAQVCIVLTGLHELVLEGRPVSSSGW